MYSSGSIKLDPHGLMIRSLSRGIDAMRPEPACQPASDKDEIEAFGLVDEIHRMNADRGWMHFIGVEHGPGVTETGFAACEWGEDLLALGRGGGEIHIAAQQRLRGPWEHLEGPTC
jgi:hypothetical protein